MKFMFIILFINLLAIKIYGQESEPINTDRPDQSDGSYVLPINKVQLENGITLMKNVVLNNFMIRFGITNSTELRFLSDFGKIDNANGFLPIGMSIKQKLLTSKNRLPSITLVGYYRNENLASKEFSTNNNSYQFIVAFQNDVSDNFGIGYNIGTSNFAENLDFTTSLSLNFTDKIIGFLEYFSHFEKEVNSEHNFDLGILYQIKNNFQLDAAFGKSLTNNNDLEYLTFGTSFRFN